MIHSFLLIGQSNMAGRGEISEVEPITDSRLKMLRMGRWKPMSAPVNCDSVYSGISLAESFAKAYADKYDVEVGLIPCASGDTNLTMWGKDELLYDHAVFQAKLAQRTSEIKGVLWHQGEADCSEDRYSLYEEKFTRIMKGLREDLNLPDVPFLLGGLGDYLKDFTDNPALKNYYKVNEALNQVCAKNPNTAFVSAEGLTPNPDILHFNAKSLREFGMRYFDAFCMLTEK